MEPYCHTRQLELVYKNQVKIPDNDDDDAKNKVGLKKKIKSALHHP